MANLGKIIEILDPQAGTLKETVIEEPSETQNIFEVKSKSGKRMTLEEASTTADFPVLLREGIRSITFDSYAGFKTTWAQWAAVMQSDKQSEDWVEENAIGELPVVSEGTPYAEFAQSLDRTLNIRNYKRGGIISVTEEMIKFNKTNLIKRQAEQLGRAAARTREVACYSVINTTGNYVRNSTTNDNDIGANTSSNAFNGLNLNAAMATLRTMKDRKTGVYLGVNPDTLIVSPDLEVLAKQMLLSPILTGIFPAQANASIYGQGSSNPFKGVINSIIVSPFLGTTYKWVLMEAKQAVMLQEVESMQILQEAAGMVNSEAYFKYDNIRYRVRDWYGVGMLNDRFAYYSTGSTPVIS